MPGKIDKNIDTVTVNGARRLLRRETREVAKMFNRLTHLFRVSVRCIQRIDRHLEASGIERRHQSIRKGEHNVLPNIGREIADVKTPLSRLMPAVIELPYIRKKGPVFLRCMPILCK